jgi:hypothetical protein
MHDLPQVMPGVQHNGKEAFILSIGSKRRQSGRVVASRPGIQAPAAWPGMEADKCLQSTDKSPALNCYI